MSAALRLRVLIESRRLDELLAEGRNPAMDPRLALRAAQLARPARRAALAAALRDARSCTRAGPQAPVDTDSVRACSSELTDLSRALTGSAPRVRGVAIARVLLTDGCSPLYRRGETDRLRNTLRTARSAL